MSKEWMLKTLEQLGFGFLDAQVYSFLALNGPQTSRALAADLQLERRKLQCILRRLHDRGFAKVTLEVPAFFSAVPLDILLGDYVEANRKEAKQLQQNRAIFLAVWRMLLVGDDDQKNPQNP